VNYIVLAIPVFFLLIGVELVVARVQRRSYYRLNDTISDLSCGVLDQLLDAFAKTALFAGYLFLHDRFRLFEIPASAAWAWAACFLGVDFLYYWFHRLSHEVNALWAAHIVHHQSEEYNLAVALRQGAFQSAFSWAFYLPLALLGFPPLVFLAVSSFNTLYQFWIHTRTIGRLGPLEWVFNTPSNHRVHHARNPCYIDKNHGGTLIVWDRLFGTYAAEAAEPVYGITTPLASWNPVWAHLHYWVELARKARQATRPPDRLRLLVARPGWLPEELGGFQPAPEVDPTRYRKFDTRVPRGLASYVLAQFVPTLLGVAVLLNLQDRLPSGWLAAGALAIVATLVTLAGLLEQRVWALPAEALRLVAGAAALAALGLRSGLGLPAALAATLLAALLVAWLWRARPAAAAATASAGLP
jgi:alkylglycerol monooxygenase